ncbi:MAG: MarR family transcriptional regulator [Candidatus Promineofilum sp.]|nr:MarR family transcriptional regulator [Promineifilum sp.]
MAESVRLYDVIKESFLLLDFGDRLFLAGFGLTVSRYYVLAHVAREPGLSPSSLSRYMFCDKSNITRLVHGLQDNGLIDQQPHERDGRTHRLFLTASGATLYGQASRAHRRYIEVRLQVAEVYRTEQLIDTLAHLNRSLTEALDNIPELPPI